MKYVGNLNLQKLTKKYFYVFPIKYFKFSKVYVTAVVISVGGPAHPPGYRRRGLRQLRLRRLRLPHPDHDRPAPGADRF